MKFNDNPATDKMIDYAEFLLKKAGMTHIRDSERRMRVRTALRSMSFDEVHNIIDRYVTAYKLQTGKIIAPPVEVRQVVEEI
jgi:hypothetical protein